MEARAAEISPWSERERRAWRPQAPLRPSEWAETHRRLYRSAIPGRYRNANAPYLRGIMDIPTRPGCIQANIKKAAQIGVSEAMRNVIGYWAEREPDPVGLTLPDRSKGRKIVKRDLLPLFRRTPVLRRLLDRPARNALLEEISLSNGFQVDLMWAGSATSTASNPYRRVINDETDKFEPWAGEEPDPIGRTWKRMRTYGNRRLQFNVSTPTTTAGEIHGLFEGSTVKLYYYVPCPRCGEYQRLVWTQLKWAKLEGATNKKVLADRIVREGAAWYECSACGERITNEQKAGIVGAGRWSTTDGGVADAYGEWREDAEAVEQWPVGTRIGMQISALYCLWESWADVAAEFLRAEGDLTKSFNFRTETLGEPYEFMLSRAPANVFAAKCRRATLPAEIVPGWAWLLLATIDTQKDHFYGVIRAWGGGMRSQRVWHGKVMSFEELDRLILGTHWPVEGDAGPPMIPPLALIDSGGSADAWLDTSRTLQVYEWVVPRQAIVRAIKGASRPGPGLYWPMRDAIGRSGESRRAAPTELRGWMIDTQRCNDQLADWIARGVPRPGGRPSGEDEQPEIWMLNQNNDAEYNSHMAALCKSAEHHGGKVIERWKPVHSGGRWDYRDCEAYQVAAAYMANVHLLPGEAELQAIRKRESEHFRAARGGRPAGGGGWEPTTL